MSKNEPIGRICTCPLCNVTHLDYEGCECGYDCKTLMRAALKRCKKYLGVTQKNSVAWARMKDIEQDIEEALEALELNEGESNERIG